jgi:class 3 adenylate cyclase
MDSAEQALGYGTRESALLQFAAYVRDNPEAVREDPSRLAGRFNLPEEMIRESLEAAGHPPTITSRPPIRLFGDLARLFRRFGATIGRNPYAAAVFAGFAWGFFNWVLGVFTDERVAPGRVIYVSTGIVLLGLINYLGGRARYALPTSAIMAGITSAMVLAMYGAVNGMAMSPRVFALSLVFSVINTAAAFAPVSFGMALLGAYRRFVEDQKDEQRKDRLYHLQRVFALEEQLAETDNLTMPLKPTSASSIPRWLAFGRKHWLWLSIGGGLMYGLLSVAEAYGRGAGIPGPTTLWAVANGLFFMAAYIVLILAAGLCGGTWYKGLIAASCIVVFSGLVQLWPVEGLGAKFIFGAYSHPSEVAIELVRISAGGLAGLSAMVEERNRRLRRIAANDQSALLAEILRVRQLLQRGVSSVCVLAVDCAQSTEMKYCADPLAVEFSFREFHGFIARTVVDAGGSVQTTAGDSAIAQFLSASSAYVAAVEIQARIGEFNRSVNKLALPFRLRIGLHCGTVHGGLREVQFSDVIDVASHLQRYAPVGGIAVSESAIHGLPTVTFVDSGERVSGLGVYIPTEYAATPASATRML